MRNLPEQSDDADLLRQYARDRDDVAFARVVARHTRAVRHIAYRHTHDNHAADDVTQAAFIVLARRPRAAMRSARRRRTALPWLAKVCRYAAGNWRRSERRRSRREQVVARADVYPDPTAGHDLADAIRSALACLPRRDRRLVELRHVSQMSWDQVAREAGTSPDAARKATSRALVRLREVLDQRGVVTGTAAVVAALARSAAALPVPPATAASLASSVLLTMKIKALSTAALATAATLGLAASVYALAPDSPPPAATQPIASSKPFVVDLGGGGRLEVLYVAEHKPGGRVWNPDGSPSDRERLFADDDVIEKGGLLEVAVRVTTPAGQPFFTYTTQPTEAGVDAIENWRWGVNEAVRQQRQPLRDRGFDLVVVDPAADTETVAINTTVPLGEWQVLHRWNNIGISGNMDASAREAGGIATPAAVGTFASDMADDDGSPMLQTRWFLADAEAWQLDTRARLSDGTMVDMGEVSYSGSGGHIGVSTLKGHHRAAVEFFELMGRPKGGVSLSGLAARPDVESEPLAEVDEAATRPESAWPEGGRPKFEQAVEVDVEYFSWSFFALRTQEAIGLPVGIDTYLLRGAGIRDHGSTDAKFTAAAGDDVLDTLDAAVKRHDERLGVIWQSGRFLITLDPDLTPPPVKPGESYE